MEKNTNRPRRNSNSSRGSFGGFNKEEEGSRRSRGSSRGGRDNKRSGSNFGGGRSFGGGRGGSRGGGRPSFGPKEMHKAICADCKKECEVPFKPTEGGKPVYCRDCFPKHKPPRY